MKLHPVHAPRPRTAAGLLALTALAPTAAVALGQSTTPAPTIALSRSAVPVGESLAVRGRAGREAAGRVVALEYAPAGRSWRRISSSRVARSGAFSLRARPATSGALRAVVAPPEATTADSGGATPRASRARHVAVAARLAVSRRELDVVAGRSAVVSGRLAPRAARRRVRVEVQRDGRWTLMAGARTGRGGMFRVAWQTRRTQSSPVRVVFPGDAHNTPARESLGRFEVFRYALASWYGPGLYGNHLGCGGRLGYGTLGVANKSLPCGTLLTVRWGTREVRVPVVDRGPYVGNREFDLTEATARRLHFHSVGSVLVTR